MAACIPSWRFLPHEMPPFWHSAHAYSKLWKVPKEHKNEKKNVKTMAKLMQWREVQHSSGLPALYLCSHWAESRRIYRWMVQMFKEILHHSPRNQVLAPVSVLHWGRHLGVLWIVHLQDVVTVVLPGIVSPLEKASRSYARLCRWGRWTFFRIIEVTLHIQSHRDQRPHGGKGVFTSANIQRQATCLSCTVSIHGHASIFAFNPKSSLICIYICIVCVYVY